MFLEFSVKQSRGILSMLAFTNKMKSLRMTIVAKDFFKMFVQIQFDLETDIEIEIRIHKIVSVT